MKNCQNISDLNLFINKYSVTDKGHGGSAAYPGNTGHEAGMLDWMQPLAGYYAHAYSYKEHMQSA